MGIDYGATDIRQYDFNRIPCFSDKVRVGGGGLHGSGDWMSSTEDLLDGIHDRRDVVGQKHAPSELNQARSEQPSRPFLSADTTHCSSVGLCGSRAIKSIRKLQKPTFSEDPLRSQPEQFRAHHG